MRDALTGLYPWVKAAHVVGVIAWMAALLYLPRLFVYHAENVQSREVTIVLRLMERRLARIIMTPAMAWSWAMGAILVWSGEWFHPLAWWLAIKIVLVVAMTAFHGLLLHHLGELANDGARRSSRYFRAINEVPALLMAIIVVLAVAKPF